MRGLQLSIPLFFCEWSEPESSRIVSDWVSLRLNIYHLGIDKNAPNAPNTWSHWKGYNWVMVGLFGPFPAPFCFPLYEQVPASESHWIFFVGLSFETSKNFIIIIIINFFAWICLCACHCWKNQHQYQAELFYRLSFKTSKNFTIIFIEWGSDTIQLPVRGRGPPGVKFG